jgi:hypothetical protein
MVNAVAVAKLNDAGQNCQLDDVQYWQDYTMMYSVTPDGEPFTEVDSTDGDFRCYYCENCGQEFDNFEKVKAHLG